MSYKLLKEEKELRKHIKRLCAEYWGGEMRHVNMSKLYEDITALVRAVREDCIAAYHDYLSRPTKFNGISFEDALRKGMRWRKTAIRRRK